MSAHVDHHLSAAAAAYRPAGFIADRIFRLGAPVQEQLPAFSLSADVTLEDRANTDTVFITQWEEGRLRRTLDALFLDWEVRLAGLFQAQRNVGHHLPPLITWVDYANSRPLPSVEGARNAVRRAGPEPDTILFSGTAWRHFRRSKSVLDQFPSKAGGGLYPSARQIEELLGLRVLVGNAWQNSAQEGRAMNLAPIWGAGVWVYYAGWPHPPADGEDDGPFGEIRPVAPGQFRVCRKPFDNRRHVLELEVQICQRELILNTAACAQITNVTEGDPA